jgi:hypothetical protein
MASKKSETGTGEDAARSNFHLDNSLRGHLETNADVVTVVSKPVPQKLVGALSAMDPGSGPG